MNEGKKNIFTNNDNNKTLDRMKNCELSWIGKPMGGETMWGTISEIKLDGSINFLFAMSEN